MILQDISDVHTEWHSDAGRYFAENLPVEGDVLILPGDITTYSTMTMVLEILCTRFSFVVYVCGNHEYWGTYRGKIHNKLAKLAHRFDNFYHLNNNFVDIGGQRFIGATLWWQATLDAWPAILSTLEDFKRIKGYKNWVETANFKAKRFLSECIQKGDVVVTHHTPSWKSRPKWRNYKHTDQSYYNNLDELILEKNPKVWYHGHTHDQVNYLIGDTSIISSPHGYKQRPDVTLYSTFKV